MTRHLFFKFAIRAVVLSLFAAAIVFPLRSNSTSSMAASQYDTAIRSFSSEGMGCVLYSDSAGMGCRQSQGLETEILRAARDRSNLREISPIRPMSTGLNIIVRGTEAFEQNAQVKAAFMRAAALWESVIQTELTVIIDVDYGTTWFGSDFPEGVVGFAHSQLLFGEPIYPRMMTSFYRYSTSDAERLVYDNFPRLIVSTELGDTQAVVAPSALFRVLGFIPRHASDDEPDGFGPPPAIGFKSTANWDFNPEDGIGADQVDFDAVACHEIGHVLGFYSYVGVLELNEERPLAVSIWDLFRVKPGTSLSALMTAERKVTSEGDQVFFSLDGNLPLSTARPDGTEGDGRQASHWKDDQISNQVRIGVLDPTIPVGRRQPITLKDLAALDMFGYAVRPVSGNSSPALTNLAGSLVGNILILDGRVTDPDGDIVKAKLQLLDSKEKVLGTTVAFDVDFGIPTTQFFTFPYPSMETLPAVTQVNLTVIDSKGNESSALLADFSGGDTGGPQVKTASFKGGSLSIKGKKFGPQSQIEVNGVIINPSSGVVPISSKKMAVTGEAPELNLRLGANRVRVINNGLRSNIFVLTFQ